MATITEEMIAQARQGWRYIINFDFVNAQILNVEPVLLVLFLWEMKIVQIAA